MLQVIFGQFLAPVYADVTMLANKGCASQAGDVWALAVTIFNFAYTCEKNPFFKWKNRDTLLRNFETCRKELKQYLLKDTKNHSNHAQLNVLLDTMFSELV